MKLRFNPLFLIGALSLVTTHSWGADRVKANNALDLNLAGSWTNGIPGAADVAVWDATTTTGNTVLLGTNTSWQGIRIANPGGTVTLNASAVPHTLTLGAAGVDVSSVVTVPANLTINPPVLFAAPQTWDFAANRSSTVNGTITGAGNNFTKKGAGIVVWNAAVTGVPSITINEGSLRAAEGVSLPGDSSLILNGGVFESSGATFTRGFGTAPGQVSITPNTASGFSASGSAAVTFNLGNNLQTLTWGSPEFNPAPFVLNGPSANNTLILQNPINLNGADRTIEVRGNTAELTGAVSGGGSLIKTGGGTLTLSAPSTFTGNVVVSNGGLRAAEGTSLPSGSNLNLNGGVFESTGTFSRALGTAASQVRLSSGSSGFSANGAGALTVNLGNNASQINWQADSNFNPEIFVLNNYSTTGTVDFRNPLNLGTAYRAFDVRAATATISGIISGTGGFTLNGTNASGSSNSLLVLSGQNTFSGRLTIANTSGGGAGGRTRLVITQDRNLGAAPSSPYIDNINIVTGGVFQANESLVLNPNRSIGIGSSGGGTVTGNIGVLANKHLTIGGVVADRTYSANNLIPSSNPNIGNLNKIEAGALLLSNPANTYSGSTTVSTGILSVNKIANGGANSGIGKSSSDAANLVLNTGRLTYLGEGDTTDRLFSLNSGTSAIESSGAGPLVFSNTGAHGFIGTGVRGLTLSGYNAGANKLAGSLPTGPAGVSAIASWAVNTQVITVAGTTTTGLAAGQIISGPGIQPNTVINSISGQTLNISLATTLAGTDATISTSVPLNLAKNGSGNWIISGENLYTGSTRINGGGTLTFDYTTADPVNTGTIISQAGTVAFRGKPTGTTTDTLTNLQLSESSYGLGKTVLESNGGAGVTLNVTRLEGSSSSQRHDLVDLSSNSANTINVAGLGTHLRQIGGVLMNNGSTDANSRASLIVRSWDSIFDTFPSYGFANYDGEILRRASETAMNQLIPGSSTVSTNTQNVLIGFKGNYTLNGTVAGTDPVKFSTLTINPYPDGTTGAVNITVPTTLSLDNRGKAILVQGRYNVAINSTATSRPVETAIWFHNYLDSNATFTFGLPLGSLPAGQVIMFGGTGFTIYTGQGFGSSFMSNGSPIRVTADQDLSAVLPEIRFTSGAVFEVGADLNGATTGDFTKLVGAAAGNVRFFGDGGVSAYTATAGGTRIINFGQDANGLGQALVWGSGSFLTNVDGNTDGDYTFKLSTAKSNATVEVKNNLSLNNRNRVIEVADGINGIDARLSGVLSGAGVGFTKTGVGVLELTGANTFTGELRVAAGKLRLAAGSLAAGSRLRIDTNNLANVEVAGSVTVQSLSINGVVQPAGTYTNVSSIAGTVIVTAGAPTITPYEQWVIDKAIPADRKDPAQDADSDGLLNLLEYAVGSEPMTSSASVLTKGSGNTINFSRASGRTDLTSVIVEVSTTLAAGSWTEIAKSTAGAAFTSSVAGVTVSDTGTGAVNPVTVTDGVTPAPAKKFYRLRVTKP